MRKPAKIELFLITALAAACVEDSAPQVKEEAKRCVDKDNKVVDDRHCVAHQANSGGGHAGSPGMFFWYFGGTGGYHPGSAAGGGSFQPSPGYRSYSPQQIGGYRAPVSLPGHSAPGTARGGFGATGVGRASTAAS